MGLNLNALLAHRFPEFLRWFFHSESCIFGHQLYSLPRHGRLVSFHYGFIPHVKYILPPPPPPSASPQRPPLPFSSLAALWLSVRPDLSVSCAHRPAVAEVPRNERPQQRPAPAPVFATPAAPAPALVPAGRAAPAAAAAAPAATSAPRESAIARSGMAKSMDPRYNPDMQVPDPPRKGKGRGGRGGRGQADRCEDLAPVHLPPPPTRSHGIGTHTPAHE